MNYRPYNICRIIIIFFIVLIISPTKKIVGTTHLNKIDYFNTSITNHGEKNTEFFLRIKADNSVKCIWTTFILYEKTDYTFNVIKSWSKYSNNNFLSFYKTHSISEGRTYKIIIKITMRSKSATNSFYKSILIHR